MLNKRGNAIQFGFFKYLPDDKVKKLIEFPEWFIAGLYWEGELVTINLSNTPLDLWANYIRRPERGGSFRELYKTLKLELGKYIFDPTPMYKHYGIDYLPFDRKGYEEVGMTVVDWEIFAVVPDARQSKEYAHFLDTIVLSNEKIPMLEAEKQAFNLTLEHMRLKGDNPSSVLERVIDEKFTDGTIEHQVNGSVKRVRRFRGSQEYWKYERLRRAMKNILDLDTETLLAQGFSEFDYTILNNLKGE